MIDTVYAILAELGLHPSQAARNFYTRLAGNLTFIVFGENGLSYQVKISTALPLDNEYASMQRAYAALPSNVAQPLALVACDGYQFMVCRGLTHQVLLNIDSEKLRRIFVREINLFTTAMTAHCLKDEKKISHSQNVDSILAHFKGTALSPLLHGWIAPLMHQLDKLPHIAQHGDFAINNIALAKDHLVYFDWEDFGKVSLPGFDICVLLMSLTRFDIEQLRVRLSEESSIETLMVEHCCHSTGIQKQMFYKLIPVYLLLFLHLKDIFNYGEKIMSQTINTLNAYLAQPFHVAIKPAPIGVTLALTRAMK